MLFIQKYWFNEFIFGINKKFFNLKKIYKIIYYLIRLKKMKKTIQLTTKRSFNSSKYIKRDINPLKPKKNSSNENKLCLNKSSKFSLGNSLICNKSKSKTKLQNSNIYIKETKSNNFLLSKNYIKLSNNKNIQLKKIVKTPTKLKKESKIYYEKIYCPKVLINSNIKHQKQNTIIKAYNNSYSKTAVSTNNNNGDITNNSKRNENIDNLLKSLIENTDLREIEKISKIDLLKNNVFLLKIYSFLYNLLSKEYSIDNLENNLEIKKQFKELINKIELFNNNKFINGNIINADLFDCINNFHNDNNNIFQESTNRKLIYKTFFDFYKKILNDIVKLSNQLPLNKKYSNKQIEDLLLSSFNSNINLSQKDFENSISIFSSYDINDEKNIIYGLDDSNEISILENDFYQQIIINNEKKKNINIHSRNELKNNNLISSVSTIMNHCNDSDSEIIENSSDFCSENNNNKLDENKKQISVPLMKHNKKFDNFNKNIYFNKKYSETKLNKNSNKLKNDIVKKPILNDEHKCYLF